MKNHLASNLLLIVSVAALGYSIFSSPPSNVPWMVFVDEPSPVLAKAAYLGRTYLWPAFLAFVAITLFQLQFRVAAGGATKRTVFGLCVLASGAMLLALRTISFAQNSAPAYVVGMAAGYTMMSRLYGVRVRELKFGLRLPWPTWRGNAVAVAEFDRMIRERHARRA
jgi:hypothetical protein